MGWPVGRVLSRRTAGATIHLRRPLPVASSGLPACSGGPPSITRAPDASQKSGGAGLLDLAPGGVYRAGPVTRTAGGLLHHRFTLTAPGVSRLRPLGGLRTSTSEGGSLFSVALSRGSPRVAVGHHPALWSPDLPRRTPPVSGRVRRGRPASPSADSVAVAEPLRPVVG
jgi:hypothetical protein